jgi:hypothetical protein
MLVGGPKGHVYTSEIRIFEMIFPFFWLIKNIIFNILLQK